MSRFNDAELYQAIEEVGKHGSIAKAAKALGIPRTTLSDRYHCAREHFLKDEENGRALKKIEEKNGFKLIHVGTKKVTQEDLIKQAGIDLEVFEVVRVESNEWEVAGKLNQGQEFDKESGQLRWKGQVLWKAPLNQLKVTLTRKSDDRLALQLLLKEIESASPVVRKYKHPRPRDGKRRALEISIMDPHLGLRCIAPESQDTYDIEGACNLFSWALDTLLLRSKLYPGIEEIVIPIGNDFLHTDGVFHQTTAGTPQPEMDAWHHIWLRGEQLLIDSINKLKKIAPVKVLPIPGNHDLQSTFCMGRVMKAYFNHDKNVEVDASASPYKFWQYGCNLVGFEHGHSINAVRMAALMANECPEGWLASKGGYREWHCGDQHRKGSSKPSAFEEQGVSIEFLPGLTGVNSWHKRKSCSWQKRGALGWVWDRDEGPIARLQCNLNSYTGRPMGEAA
jgi:hypothetical protein